MRNSLREIVRCFLEANAIPDGQLMTRRRSRAILFTLIACHAILVLVAGLLPTVVKVPDEFDDLPVAVLAVCQMSLLALWIGFGGGPVVVRLLIGLLTGAALMVLFLTAEEGRFTLPTLPLSQIAALTAGMILGPMVSVGIPAWIARGRGVKIVWQEHPPAKPSGNFQFSLRWVLIGSVLLSVLLGACRWLAPTGGRESTPYVLTLFVMVAGIMLASVALVAVWASLRDGPLLVRLGVASAAALLAGFLAGYAIAGPQAWPLWFILAGVALIESMILNASLLSLRAAGYRAANEDRSVAISPATVTIPTAQTDPCLESTTPDSASRFASNKFWSCSVLSPPTLRATSGADRAQSTVPTRPPVAPFRPTSANRHSSVSNAARRAINWTCGQRLANFRYMKLPATCANGSPSKSRKSAAGEQDELQVPRRSSREYGLLFSGSSDDGQSPQRIGA